LLLLVLRRDPCVYVALVGPKCIEEALADGPLPSPSAAP
jgi:hypothetical protein